MKPWRSLYLILFFPLLSIAAELDVALPVGVEAVWVGEEIAQNGVPLQIQSFKSNLSASEVLNFYRSEWESKATKDHPGYVENSVGGWSIISYLEGDSSVVVQVKKGASGGAEGFISVAEPFNDVAVKFTKDNFPKKGGTELISITDSVDLGKKATTYILQNTFSLGANSQFYIDKMKSKKWKLNHSVIKEDVVVLLFNKNNEQCEISMSKNDLGLTTIFANIVVDA